MARILFLKEVSSIITLSIHEDECCQMTEDAEDFHFYITIELVLTCTCKMSTFTYDKTPCFGLKKEKEESIWRKTFYLSLVLRASGEASEHVYGTFYLSLVLRASGEASEHVYGTFQEPMSGKCFYSSHSVAYSYSCRLR